MNETPEMINRPVNAHEAVVRVLVAAGHVTQQKVDEAYVIAADAPGSPSSSANLVSLLSEAAEMLETGEPHMDLLQDLIKRIDAAIRKERG